MRTTQYSVNRSLNSSVATDLLVLLLSHQIWAYFAEEQVAEPDSLWPARTGKQGTRMNSATIHKWRIRRSPSVVRGALIQGIFSQISLSALKKLESLASPPTSSASPPFC
jgi:hypothetical protein